MRRLEILPEMFQKHLASYDDGIMRGLEELIDGKSLRKRNMAKKGFAACKTNLIDGCKNKSFEWLYVFRVWKFCRRFQSPCGVLGFGPKMLERSARQFARFDRRLIKRFGRKSREYKSWLRGKKKVESLFNYDAFSAGKKLVSEEDANTLYFHWEENSQWGGWRFLKQLGTATCSYCNSDGVFVLEYEQRVKKRQKEHSVIKHKKSELDHFWPRAEFPFLGLSLYNLVPSCTRCNRNIKGANYEPLGEMVHPYSHDFHDGAKFYAVFKDYKGLTHPNDTGVDVIIDRPTGPHSVDLAKRAKKSAEFFHLEEVYNQIYELEVNDVVRKVLYFPESYLADLRKRYPGIDESVLNRMTLGTSLNPADINKLPHEKLRQDIHSQLWIHSSVTKSCTCGRTR